MINSISLKDFQKHENLEVAFTPGLNVIIGPTDSGKSSVFRALKMALWNDFKSTKIVRANGPKKCVVEVEIDGHKIIRSKGAGVNTYSVDGLELKAFGAARPKEVSEAVNLESINIQSQHDPMFLLSDSAGNVAKFLNKLIDLDVIDKTLSSLSKKQSEAKRVVENTQEQIKEKKESIQEVRYIKEAKKEFRALLKEKNRLAHTTKRLDQVEEKIFRAEKHRPSMTLAEVKKMSKASYGLQELYDDYDAEVSSISNLSRKLQDLPKISTLNLSSFAKIDKAVEGLKKKYKKTGRLSALISKAERFQAFAEKNKVLVEELTSKLKGVSNECPTCKKEWK